MKPSKKCIKLFSLKKTQTNIESGKITTSKDAEVCIRQFYGDDLGIYESFFIVLLNRANTVTGYAKISQGGICGTVIDVLIIAKYAIESLAKSVILCHNHPSGNLIPSDADKQMTYKVKDTLKLFDCTVLDHVVLTEKGYLSFADEGLI